MTEESLFMLLMENPFLPMVLTGLVFMASREVKHILKDKKELQRLKDLQDPRNNRKKMLKK